MPQRKPTKIDEKYGERLEELYQKAIDIEQIDTAFRLLDKIRVFELYLDSPAEEKNDSPV